MLSSYQKLKIKKDVAEKIASDLKEDIEFLILYPYSSRAKSIRREIKEQYENG